MNSLTEDHGVVKEIVVEGKGSTPKKGDPVAIMYCVTLEDGTVIADSFLTKQPLHLNAGEEQSIPGVDIAILNMKWGEKSKLTVEPKYGYGAFDNSMGFHGSGKRIPPNSKLFLEIHLLHPELAIEKTTEEWIKTAETIKLEGNKAFESGDNINAQKSYEKAVQIIEGLEKQIGANTEEKVISNIKELKISCLSNLAATHLKSNNFIDAKSTTQKILSLEPQNIKALFRCAKANRGMDNYEEALKLLKSAEQIKKTKEIVQEISECTKLLKEKENNERKMFSGIFNKLDSGLYSEVEPGKPEKWKCDICGEETDEIQKARHIIKKHSDPKK